MAAQRKKGPVNQKRFVVLLDGEGHLDHTLAEQLKKRVPEIIFETLATLEVKNITTLADALGVTRDRLVGLLKDFEVTEIYQHVRRWSRKRAPSNTTRDPAKK